MSRYSAVNSIHSFDAKSVRISFLMKQTITSTRAGTNRKFPEEKKALISNRGWLGDEPARHTNIRWVAILLSTVLINLMRRVFSLA